MAWKLKENDHRRKMLNVVDEDGRDVAFFQREDDATRCVEAVNSVERLREALNLAVECLRGIIEDGPGGLTGEDAVRMWEDAAETLREIAALAKEVKGRVEE